VTDASDCKVGLGGRISVGRLEHHLSQTGHSAGFAGRLALRFVSRRTIQPLILPHDRRECTVFEGIHTQRPGGQVQAPACVSRIASPASRPHNCASTWLCAAICRIADRGNSHATTPSLSKTFGSLGSFFGIHGQASHRRLFLDYLQRNTLNESSHRSIPWY
jgi:hypothetical protein